VTGIRRTGDRVFRADSRQSRTVFRRATATTPTARTDATFFRADTAFDVRDPSHTKDGPPFQGEKQGPAARLRNRQSNSPRTGPDFGRANRLWAIRGGNVVIHQRVPDRSRSGRQLKPARRCRRIDAGIVRPARVWRAERRCASGADTCGEGFGPGRERTSNERGVVVDRVRPVPDPPRAGGPGAGPMGGSATGPVSEHGHQ
jgi:hypothetical protein